VPGCRVAMVGPVNHSVGVEATVNPNDIVSGCIRDTSENSVESRDVAIKGSRTTVA